MEKNSSDHETYYAVSSSYDSGHMGVFQELRLGPRARGRVMKKQIFDRAVRDADDQLRRIMSRGSEAARKP